jgi:hypothetical protein
MPHRRVPHGAKASQQNWEFLDDVSIECNNTLETEDATESVTTFEAENSSVAWSDCSNSIVSMESNSDGSAASAATLLRFTLAASEALFKPQADKPTLESITDATIGNKAVKADDAEVPTHLWDGRIKASAPEGAGSSLDSCRELELRVFRCALYLEYRLPCVNLRPDWNSMEQKKGRYCLNKLRRNADILWHASETSFFEYHAGSQLHFFRWPTKYKSMARDGIPIMFEKPGLSKKQQQSEFKDPDVQEQVRSKILKVIRRRYMIRAHTTFNIKSLIKYFAVPKGLSDIRIVYNATASGQWFEQSCLGSLLLAAYH